MAATGVLDLKKFEADCVKGIVDKTWIPIFQTAVKTCTSLNASRFCQFSFFEF
jgi:hypothetical protein